MLVPIYKQCMGAVPYDLLYAERWTHIPVSFVTPSPPRILLSVTRMLNLSLTGNQTCQTRIEDRRSPPPPSYSIFLSPPHPTPAPHGFLPGSGTLALCTIQYTVPSKLGAFFIQFFVTYRTVIIINNLFSIIMHKNNFHNHIYHFTFIQWSGPIDFLRLYTSSAPSTSMLLFIKNDDTSAVEISSAHETKIRAVTYSFIQSIWLTIFTLLHDL